ncbi:Na-translocating system protein MpsC family protein [Tumebacillus amylolyticus]|uniref:Na-translocating system protein MpsC family protein n=1 Tax=Tumebacillus amylolyticus TaxID=2801339 RepID=UPI001F353A80|nr:Na-translocating system protein MpsC family protein [Tumebacillus amylolyticus]
MQTKEYEADLSGFFGRLFRENFGKGPESVFTTMSGPFITVYLRNFIAPMERVLYEQGNEQIVEKTRDSLIQLLLPEIRAYVKILTGIEAQEIYYDWNLHNRSGMFNVIGRESFTKEPVPEESYHGRDDLHEELLVLSHQVQKTPEAISSFVLNPRTLLVLREGILVPIEKELIRLGFRETLALAKRTLEKNYLHNNNHFEAILGKRVIDLFVDWDFERDKSVFLFITKPTDAVK